jgi:iron complex outermembrane receptor protein
VLDLTTQLPLSYASVQVEGRPLGDQTDDQGFFYIEHLCRREFDLIVSYVGYKTAVHHHDVYHSAPQIFLAPDSITLQSVTVEGERTAGDLYSGTVQRLSPQEFAQQQSGSLGDLAANLSGVSTLSTGSNVAKPIIHGLHGNRVLIINNGVRHEFQNWGDEHAPEIDPSLAQDISVVKGAATVRYGPDALGGVILINPPRLELLTPLQGSAELIGQSNGRAGEASASLKKGFHRLSLLGQASVVRQGDLHAPDYQLTNTGKREQSAALSSRFHYGNFDAYAYYSHFDQELGILRGAVTGNLEDLVTAIEAESPPLTQPFSYAINNPRQTVQHDMLKLEGHWNDERQSVEVQYALQNNQRQEFDVRRGTNNQRPNIDLQLPSHSVDVVWQHPAWQHWEGSMGAQGLVQVNRNLPGTNTVPFVPNFTTQRAGVYFIEAHSLGESQLEIGARYDYQAMNIRGRQPNNELYRTNLAYHNVTATLGWVRELDEQQRLRTNVGLAWRPPNVSELYSFGRHQASLEYGLWRYRETEDGRFDTNVILDESDRAVPAEQGLKWISTYEVNRLRWQGEFTAYVNYIRKFIYTQPAGITQTVRGAFPYFVYQQDDALLMGGDATVVYAHTNRLTSTLRASYLWARNQATGEPFVGMPPADVRYRLEQRLPRWGALDAWSWNGAVHYTFRQWQAPRTVPLATLLRAGQADEALFATDGSAFDILAPPPGYLLVNVGWTGQIDRVQLGVRVTNVLNQRYRSYTDRLRYFADEVGRNVVVSVKYAF